MVPGQGLRLGVPRCSPLGCILLTGWGNEQGGVWGSTMDTKGRDTNNGCCSFSDPIPDETWFMPGPLAR